jgi:hypothetical protein
MMMTTTEVYTLLGLSTSVNTYANSITAQIPYVFSDIVEIVNHRYHDAYHWIWNDYMIFSSSNKTITLGNNSTYNFLTEFSTGETIDVISSYNNNGFYTINSITSSHIIVVDESLINENSTDYAIQTYIYRCFIPDNVKRIASKMIWYNVKNSDSFQQIASESLGSYSVSYVNSGKNNGLYPESLISGLKKKAGSW